VFIGLLFYFYGMVHLNNNVRQEVHMNTRRLMEIVLTTIFITVCNSSVFANSYPARPIRLIVPFPPGGNTDVLSRLLAKGLSDIWGQQVIVDNRPGAGGTIGTALAARAPADGHTIVMGSFGSVLLANSLYKNLSYEPMRDLAPVIMVAAPPGLLVVHPSLPAQTPADLIKLAKSASIKLNYASAGNGSWNHLFGELFKEQAKIDVTHVPYKGTVPALTDVIGGRAQWMFAPFPPALPQIRNDRLRAVAVTSPNRSIVLPDVPTVSESGLPGYEAEGWFAVLAPHGTPSGVIGKLNKTMNEILLSSEMRTTLAADGARPIGGTPYELLESMKNGIEKWRRIVKALNLQP